MICRQCPRECQIDRQGEHYGFCASPNEFLVARIGPHAWEEPPISGSRGSGTIFLADAICVAYFVKTAPSATVVSAAR